MKVGYQDSVQICHLRQPIAIINKLGMVALKAGQGFTWQITSALEGVVSVTVRGGVMQIKTVVGVYPLRWKRIYEQCNGIASITSHRFLGERL
jgi:hypothetical protein